MTRIFTEGFEFGDVLFFDAPGSSVASTTQKRSGVYSCTSPSSLSIKNITAISEFYVRFGWQSTNFASSTNIFNWRNGSTSLGQIIHNPVTNTLDLQVATTTQVAGSIVVAENSWYLIEIHVKIANDPDGVLECKIDGVANGVTFTGDTQPAALTTIDNVGWKRIATTDYIDDLALNDTAGGVDDSWCGDGKVILLVPDANGDSSGFTNSSGTSTNNYGFVDDIPSDNDISYVQASSSGTLDLYNLSACGLTDVTIARVWAEARARDTVAEGGQISLTMKTESTEYDSSAITLLTTYTQCLGTVHKVNPQTTSAWSTTQLDALQVGSKVI